MVKLLVYVVVVVLIAAVLAPPIYWMGMSGVIPGLDGYPFFRYFGRIAQIAALVLLWPMALWLRVRSLGQLGLERNRRAAKDVGAGVVMAVVPLIVLAAAYLYFGVYKLRDEVTWLTIVRILGTATFVSVFEEFLFRGVLLGLACQSLGRRAGIVVISAVFALVHFFKPRTAIAPEDVTWGSGFALVGGAFSGSETVGIFLAGCVTLFFIGLLLAQTRFATRSLWLAIGLHGGWILGQQTLNLLAKFRVKPADALLPWIGPNVVSGMVPTGVVPMVALLVTAGAACWYCAAFHRKEPGAGVGSAN